jgi:hypothetical protein
MIFRRIAANTAAGLAATARAVPGLVVDAIGLCGVGAIAYGAWLIYPPAGFIVGGIMVVAGVWWLSAKTARRSG